MAPGNAVDDGEALRANIVATVGAYLHPTSTVPMGAASDPTAVVDAQAQVRLGQRHRHMSLRQLAGQLAGKWEELLRGQQEALIFAPAAVRLLVEKFGFTATRRRQKKKRGGGRQCQHRTHWFEVSAAVGRASSLPSWGTRGRPAN
jgi:hypothetical protein